MELSLRLMFWSSVVLTGNQTVRKAREIHEKFWSSVVLTGNQTSPTLTVQVCCFGAVSFWLVIKLMILILIRILSFGAVSFWLVIKRKRPVFRHLGSFGAVSFWLVIKPSSIHLFGYTSFGAVSFWPVAMSLVLLFCRAQNMPSIFLKNVYHSIQLLYFRDSTDRWVCEMVEEA